MIQIIWISLVMRMINFIAIMLLISGLAIGQDGAIVAPQKSGSKKVVRAKSAEKEKLKENLKSLFTWDSLYKLFFSEEQDELVNAYLSNFRNTSELKIRQNFNRTLKESPAAGLIKEDGVFVRFYARIHKDDNILLSLVGMFKDRSQIYLFVIVSAFLFFLGYLRKKYKKKIKGTPMAFIKNLMLTLVIIGLHLVSIMFFFGDNLRPAIMAYKEIEREVSYQEKL